MKPKFVLSNCTPQLLAYSSAFDEEKQFFVNILVCLDFDDIVVGVKI